MKLNCGHEAGYSLRDTATDYVSLEQFELVECNLCNLVQTKIDLNQNYASDYYPDSYYGDLERYNPVLNFIVRLLAKKRANLVKNILPESAKVLDIGCGQGWVLDYLQRMGCEVTGVEVSEQAATHARQVLNLNILIGDVRDINLKPGDYDCVIIWHVLEHVKDPMGLLEHIKMLLKPEGILLVAVPDFASLESKTTNMGWFHLDVPRHLSHFEKHQLEQFFTRKGFHKLKFSNFVAEYDFFSFMQSILNRLGLQQNCLYSFLRRNSQGSLIKSPLKYVDLCVSLILAPVLGFVSLFWITAVTVFNKAATIIYVLKKNS